MKEAKLEEQFEVGSPQWVASKCITVQGGKKYLEVKYRLEWFRAVHPDYGIITYPTQINLEDGYAIFHAEITNGKDDITLSSGTKCETKVGFYDDGGGFHDFIEKAETGAIGRALAAFGFGTQFAPELEEGDRLADAPVSPRSSRSAATRSTTTKPSGSTTTKPVGDLIPCDYPGCQRKATAKNCTYSQRDYGMNLCWNCQQDIKNGNKSLPETDQSVEESESTELPEGYIDPFAED